MSRGNNTQPGNAVAADYKPAESIMIETSSLPRVLSCGTGPGAASITEALKQSDEVEHVLSFGRKAQDYHMATITRTRSMAGKMGELTDHDRYSGTLAQSISPDRMEQFYRFLFQFADHLHRRESQYHYRPHRLETLHEYINYYHLMADIFASRIKDHGINVVLFFNAPHLGFDTLCYQVAKLMEIPTLVLMQTIFPNKFVSCSEVETCGKIDLTDIPDNVEIYPIEREESPDLFYMDKVTPTSLRKGLLNPKDLLLVLTYILTREPALLRRPAALWSLFRRACSVKSSFPRFRDPFADFFHVNQLDYFETLAEFENQPVNLERDYVYFPLHLQPEATTSAMGGIYMDQALAIEHLSMLLPDNCAIYVKENPKQRHFMRDPLFFHRLNRIPSVQIVPSMTCTYQLTDNSRFVATVTGTAGWEAICRGRNVVAFGHPWYASFPGVFPYHPDLSYDELVSHQVSHDLLQKATGHFLNQIPDGIVYERYKPLVPDFDQQKNISMVVPYIIDVIKGRRSPVFVSNS